jgi:hypothetical protein
MSVTLEFKTVAYDSVALPLGFPDIHTSDAITAQQEAAVVQWLLGRSPAKGLVMSELKLSEDVSFWPAVAEPVTDLHRKPGDVDALLCGRDSPHTATAVEAKCVKVVAVAVGQDRVNRLGKLSKAVQQVNGLRDMGFHESYLAVLCLVDAQERLEPNTVFREMSPKTLSRVYDFPCRDDLHREVGFLIVEIAQPTAKGFNRMANINVCRVQAAIAQDQPIELTNRIAEYVKYH